jgi:hypothetical protein
VYENQPLPPLPPPPLLLIQMGRNTLRLPHTTGGLCISEWSFANSAEGTRAQISFAHVTITNTISFSDTADVVSVTRMLLAP